LAEGVQWGRLSRQLQQATNTCPKNELYLLPPYSELKSESLG